MSTKLQPCAKNISPHENIGGCMRILDICYKISFSDILVPAVLLTIDLWLLYIIAITKLSIVDCSLVVIFTHTPWKNYIAIALLLFALFVVIRSVIIFFDRFFYKKLLRLADESGWLKVTNVYESH